METLQPLEIDLQSNPEQIWQTLVNFKNYGDWNSIVPYVSGELIMGEELRVTLVLPGDKVESGPCKVEKVIENEYYILSRKILSERLLYMEHAFIMQSVQPELNKYKFIQTLKVSGILWPVLKSRIKKVWLYFEQMNKDLKTQLEKPKHYGQRKRSA